MKAVVQLDASIKYSKGSGLSLYRFPPDKGRRDKWISTVK